MGELIRKIISEFLTNAKLTDMEVGTVTSIEPLEIQLIQTMLPLPRECLYLTGNVIEKTIDKLEHTHQYYDSDTGEGASGSATRTTDPALVNYQVMEDGKPLGYNKDGKMIINKGLEVGDRVLLLRVREGQKYIVLNRLY